VLTTCAGGEGVTFGTDAQEWNYGNVDSWKDLTNAASCGGDSQSPINIVTSSTLSLLDNYMEVGYIDSTTLTVEKPKHTLEALFNATLLLV
jgi:carbonic anhydrase